MRRVRCAYLAAAWLIGLSVVPHGAAAQAVTAATGYVMHYDHYSTSGRSRPIALIFMHGKGGSNDSGPMKRLAQDIAAAGFDVYLPLMPWSRRWDGTAADAAAGLDALVARVAAGGGKVAIGGQSMGAMFAIVYRAADPPPALVARVLTSPGGLLDLIARDAPFWRTLAPSMERARALEAAGKGKERTAFVFTNVIGTRSIEERYETTPDIFLSFHDPARFPSVRAALAAIRQPVFWGTGRKDPIGNAKRPTFAMIPAHPASVYLELDEDHNSMMTASRDAIVGFLRGRAESLAAAP